jgi:hypothetical protein
LLIELWPRPVTAGKDKGKGAGGGGGGIDADPDAALSAAFDRIGFTPMLDIVD